MVSNPPQNWPRIVPSLYYDDPKAAMDWLARAFGFEIQEAVPGPGGEIVHAEMRLMDGLIMIGPTSAMPEWHSPRALEGSITQELYVYVDDVDAHCERARGAGARVVSEPEEKFYGDRNYRVEDLEGHRWTFAQHVRDVPPEEYGQPG